jgi:hypothetical protein
VISKLATILLLAVALLMPYANAAAESSQVYTAKGFIRDAYYSLVRAEQELQRCQKALESEMAAWTRNSLAALGHVENTIQALTQAEVVLKRAAQYGGGGMNIEASLNDLRRKRGELNQALGKGILTDVKTDITDIAWIREQVELFLNPKPGSPGPAYTPAIDGRALKNKLGNILN